jgi:hypothetical protein
VQVEEQADVQVEEQAEVRVEEPVDVDAARAMSGAGFALGGQTFGPRECGR